MPTRGDSSCWMLVETSELYPRVPHPLMILGSNELLGRTPPKPRSEIVPQKSPPVGRRSCCCGLVSTQSGMKLRLASVHVRVTELAMFDTGLPCVGSIAST